MTRRGASRAADAAFHDAYEAEQARVCAAFPQCRTDGSVRAAYLDTLENFSPDWAHLNVKGQAAEAALIWPVVSALFTPWPAVHSRPRRWP